MNSAPAPAGQETRCDDRVVVWTDGASSNNGDARICRAGAGIFYSAGHSMNLAVPLLGRVQSNQRAELLAIVLALRRDPRPLEIRTDSQYCCDGACGWPSWRVRMSVSKE